MKRDRKENKAFTGDARKIGEVSAMYDLLPETLRFIEKNELVTPAYSEDGTYRIYGQGNMVELYEYLAYRNMGFAVKDIQAMKAGAGAAWLAGELQGRQRALESEAHYKALLAEQIRMQAKKLSFTACNEGLIWRETLPAGRFACFVVGGADKPFYSSNAIAWRKQAPFTQLAILHNDARPGIEAINWGLYAEARLLEALNLPQDDTMETIAERQCLCAVVRVPLAQNPYDAVTPLTDYAKAHGIALVGSALFIHLRLEKERDGQYQVFQAYAPLK